MELEPSQIRTTESGLYVVDHSVDVTTQGGVRILESGLAVVLGHTTFEIPNLLVLPRGVNRIPNGQVVLPQNIAPQPAIAIPNATEWMQVVSPTEEQPSRNSADLAVALTKAKLFLTREVDDKFDSKIPDDVNEVLTGLLSDTKFKPKKAHIRRKKETLQYWDKQAENIKTVTRTSPGAVETVAITAINLLNDANFRASARQVVFEPIAELIEDSRTSKANGKLQLPEMPDLSIKLVEALDHFPANPTLRFNIYSLLEQIKLPDSIKESLLAKMDRNRDLGHPLAFEATIGLAQSKPESPWVKLQQERRQQLLDKLGGDPQSVFDQFRIIKELSQGLVTSTNLTNPQVGKIGLEIETRFKKRPNYAPLARYNYDPIDGLPEDEWRVHPDCGNDEITRADSNLGFGLGYMDSLVDLSKWTKDHVNQLVSLHLHLDRNLHPTFPDFKHLYTDYSMTTRINSLGTWELRFLNLPKGLGSFHPGRITDAINLTIAATSPKEGNSTDNPKVTTIDDEHYSLPQLIFGHLAQIVNSPEGRLAAIMALNDETILKSINPLAFANTYTEGSLNTIAKSLEGQFKAGIDLEMLDALRVCAELGLDQAKDSYQLKYSSLTRQVLGIVDIPKPIDQHWQQAWAREPQSRDANSHIRTTLAPHLSNWWLNSNFATAQGLSYDDRTTHFPETNRVSISRSDRAIGMELTDQQSALTNQTDPSSDFDAEVTRLSQLLARGFTPDMILRMGRRSSHSLTPQLEQYETHPDQPLVNTSPDYIQEFDRNFSPSNIMEGILHYSPTRHINHLIDSSSAIEHQHEVIRDTISLTQIFERIGLNSIVLHQEIPEVSRIRESIGERPDLTRSLVSINHEINHYRQPHMMLNL